MKKESKRSFVLLKSIERGYYVDKDGNLFNPKDKLISASVVNNYLSFNFRIDGKRNNSFVHQLQAYQKFGDLLFTVECVRHLNGNKLDNSWENIELGSNRDNRLDIPKDIRKKSAKIASSYTYRFSEKEVLSIWKDRQKGSTYKELCIKYNTSKSTLSNFFNKSEYVKVILEKNHIL